MFAFIFTYFYLFLISSYISFITLFHYTENIRILPSSFTYSLFIPPIFLNIYICPFISLILCNYCNL
uniref:Uncharacterized protein n=1 Tax=Heterorhabditis bacteriophora TaxID=37862 RepID=A0A1I7WL36_HETBA